MYDFIQWSPDFVSKLPNRDISRTHGMADHHVTLIKVSRMHEGECDVLLPNVLATAELLNNKVNSKANSCSPRQT